MVSFLKKILFWIMLLTVAAIGLWVGQENSEMATFMLLGFQLGTLPLGVLVLLVFLIGTSLGALLTLPPSLRFKRQAQRLRQRLIDAERKLAKVEVHKP